MFEIETAWIKCPKCKEILYAREVEKSNKCPKPKCGYIFPYPFAKSREMEKLLLKKGTTWGEIGKFVLETLDSLKNKKQKVAFLCKTHGLVLEDFEWKQIRKKKKI